MASKTLGNSKRADHVKVALSSIVEGNNVRKDYGDVKQLAKEITARGGVKKPVWGKADKEQDKYVLTDGHRRIAAARISAKEQGISENDYFVDFMVEPANYTEKERIMDMLTMNDGKGLSDVEKAEAVKRLMEDHGMKQKEVAAELGYSTVRVNNMITFEQNATPELREAVKEKVISPTAAIQLARATPDELAQLAKIKEAREVKAKTGKKATAKEIKVSATSRLGQLYKKLEKDGNVDQKKMDFLADLIEYEAKNIEYTVIVGHFRPKTAPKAAVKG